MESRIVAAVIGCGRMGAQTSESVRRYAPTCWFPLSHAEAVKAHPGLTLSALCDTDAAMLDRVARNFGVDRTFADFRVLIDQVRPQLLCVATRTPGRAQIVEYGAAAGVQAFHVEKPLCNSRAELRSMTSLFQQGGRYLSLGAIRRHFHIYQRARELASSGRFGKLTEIRVNFGPGALYWTHPHSVDLILFAAGERRLEAVQAKLSNVALRGEGIVDSDPAIEWATMQFDDGVTGHITRASGCDLILSCTAGEVIVESDGRSMRIAHQVGDNPYFAREDFPLETVFPSSQGTLAPIDQLVGCIQGNAEARALNSRLRSDVFLGQEILFTLIESHIAGSRLIGVRERTSITVVTGRSGERFA